MAAPTSTAGQGAAPQPFGPLSTPRAFHFAVGFTRMQVGHVEAAFQEASGLSADMETETLVEGGRNDSVLTLPKAVKHPRLVLKRGIADLDSLWAQWCKDTLERGLARRLEPRTVHVGLLSHEGRILQHWMMTRAYPVKWEVDAFNSQRNELAMERIELAYETSRRMSPAVRSAA